jgi:vacuolar protein sorting-associated protein 45
MERKEDPVTPLVFDWSYMSMLNELVHIEDNKASIKGSSTSKAYNLFLGEDEFLRENLYSNYGEVASNIQLFLEKVSNKKKSTESAESFGRTY